MLLKHLSASSLRDFLTCPFKGKLAHIDRLRLAKPKAVLEFGTAVHRSIEKFYTEKKDPSETFREEWKNGEYLYTNGDSYETLRDCGKKLLNKFKSHPDTPTDPHTIEQMRYCEVGGVPFISFIDFTGDNGRLLLDWKTSSCKYPDYKAKLDLQLTAYTYVLAVTERFPERVGFGVFVKKKDPELQYLFSEREAEQLEQFERLCIKVWNDIHNTYFPSNFPKIPGNHCGMCDYIPICLGEEVPEGYYIVRG